MAFLLSQIVLIWWMQHAPPILHEPYPAHRLNPETVIPSSAGTIHDDAVGMFHANNKSASTHGDAGPSSQTLDNEFTNHPQSDLESTSSTVSTHDENPSQHVQTLLQHALQNPVIQLDSQTDSFDIPQNFLDTIFTPSVFPNERIWVFDEVTVSSSGKFGARASDSIVRILQVEPFTEPKEQVFFWATIQQPYPSITAILPTPAPQVRVDHIPNGISLYKNNKDMLFYHANSRAPAKLTLRMAVPRHYFQEPNLEQVPVPSVRSFEGAESLRTLSIRFFGRPDAGFLGRMSRYFRSFEVLKLRHYPPSVSLEEAILMQKRGVCRHRALLFFAIAMAWGYDVRLVLNRVHAFVELRWQGQSWTRLDLGGAQLPPSMSPPPTPDLFSPIPYTYHISTPSPARSGGKLHFTLEHRVAPPPFLWAIILDTHGREVQRTGIFPKHVSREEIHLPLLPVPGGRYRLLLRSPTQFL